MSEVNPWAICHSQVGKKKTKKFERCVMKVKAKHGLKEGIKRRLRVASSMERKMKRDVASGDRPQPKSAKDLTKAELGAAKAVTRAKESGEKRARAGGRMAGGTTRAIVSSHRSSKKKVSADIARANDAKKAEGLKEGIKRALRKRLAGVEGATAEVGRHARSGAKRAIAKGDEPTGTLKALDVATDTAAKKASAKEKKIMQDFDKKKKERSAANEETLTPEQMKNRALYKQGKLPKKEQPGALGGPKRKPLSSVAMGGPDRSAAGRRDEIPLPKKGTNEWAEQVNFVRSINELHPRAHKDYSRAELRTAYEDNPEMKPSKKEKVFMGQKDKTVGQVVKTVAKATARKVKRGAKKLAKKVKKAVGMGEQIAYLHSVLNEKGDPRPFSKKGMRPVKGGYVEIKPKKEDK